MYTLFGVLINTALAAGEVLRGVRNYNWLSRHLR